MPISPEDFLSQKYGTVKPAGKLTPEEFLARKYGGQSVDTGAQQSVYDPAAEAMVGVAAEPEKSTLERAFDLTPIGIAKNVALKTGEAVYGKPIEESWPAALEAGLDIPTGGLATAIPVVWGAAKGVAASPSQMTHGSSVLDKAGVVARSAARGAVGESPLLSTMYERVGGEPIHRVSEGENVSEVNRMVTGSPLPEWSKTAIDIGGGTLGMIGAEKGIASAAGKLVLPKIDVAPDSELRLAEQPELKTSPFLERANADNVALDEARQAARGTAEIDATLARRSGQGGFGYEGMVGDVVPENVPFSENYPLITDLEIKYPTKAPYQSLGILDRTAGIETATARNPASSFSTLREDTIPAEDVAKRWNRLSSGVRNENALRQSKWESIPEDIRKRYEAKVAESTPPPLAEMPAATPPAPSAAGALPKTQILEAPQRPTVTMEPPSATTQTLPAVTDEMRAAAQQAAREAVTQPTQTIPAKTQTLDAVDAVIENKPTQTLKAPDVTVTKGSPIEETHAGVNPTDVLKQTVSKNENVEIVRPNGEKFRILDILRSPSKIPILKPIFNLSQTALNKADVLTKQRNVVKQNIQTYLGKDEKTAQAFADALWKGDAERKRWTLDQFKNIVAPYELTPEQELGAWKAYNLRRNYSDVLAREMAKSKGNLTNTDLEAVRIMQSKVDGATDAEELIRKSKQLEAIGIDFDDVDGIMQNLSYREGHVPHVFREVMVYDKASNAPVASFKTMKEAVEWADKTAAKNPGTQLSIRPKSVKWSGQSAKAGIVNDQRYTNLLKRVENQYDMTVDEAKAMLTKAGFTPKTTKAGKEVVIGPAGQGRQFGHLRQRKGAEGFRTDDIMDIFDSYDKGAIRYISTNPFKKNATSIFEKTYGSKVGSAKGLEAKFVADYINDVNGVPGITEQAINGLFKRVMPGIAERMPTSRPGIYAANKINHAISVAKLGIWNPSALAVNLSQNILTFAKTDMDSFARAVADTAKRDKQARSIWRQLGIDSKTGLAESGEYTQSARAGDLVNSSMALFGWAEKRNREVAALAGYYDAVKRGLNHKQAIDAARKLVRETQFEYNVIDTPYLFRGALGRTLGQFKQYGTKYMETVTGMNGTEFVKWMVPTALVTGMAGIPMSKAANSVLVSTLGDEYDYDTRARQFIQDWMNENPDNGFVQAVGNTALYGAAGNLGVDVSQRIGQSDILPFFEKPEQLLGPAASTAISTAKNIAGMSYGKKELDDVLKGVSPGAEGIYLAGKEAYKAIKGDKEPTVVRGQYGENMYEPTTAEKGIRISGLRPVKESKLRQETRAEQVYRGIEEKYKKAFLNAALNDKPEADAYLEKWIKYRTDMGESVDPDSLYKSLQGMAEKQAIDRPTRKLMDKGTPPRLQMNWINE